MIALALSAFVFCNPVALESRVMSYQRRDKQFLSVLDQLWQAQGRPRFIDINAMDELDPVHYRKTDCQGERAENDYDGDGGREHSEYMRDNGRGSSRATVAGTFVQIADALPRIEAPSIVPEHTAAGEITMPKPSNEKVDKT